MYRSSGDQLPASARSRLPLLRLVLISVATLLAGAFAASSASAQSIVNQSSTGGQTNWLETFATGGETGNNANVGRITVLVKHAAARRVTALRIDDNYDGTDNTASETNVAVAAQRPNVAGGYNYSRVTYQYQVPTSGTGMSCPVFGTRTRRTVKPIRIRAVLDDGTLTPSTSSDIKFTATGQCLGSEDFPYIYSRSQNASSINAGDTVTFTYTGDDPDVSGNADFQGIRWRARRLSDGATTALQTSCPNNGDNAAKNLNVNFPNRGRWVVEAELLNNSGCTTNDNPGYFFYIGAVDVNSPASEGPTINLTATRPQKNGNTTITAAVADPTDASAGGVAEALEFDLNENTSDGVNGYEDTSLGDHASGLTAAQKTRTINTTGLSPGLHTVRARVGDNGALGGADNIRRTNVDTVQFLVDSDPVVNNQSVATETEDDLPLDLGGTDIDGDTLTYTITDPPDNGTLSGTGRNRTYTSNDGFAGDDSFTFRVADGFGGTDSATVSVRVDPSTAIDSAPSGTVATRAAQFTFSSRATGAQFECSLDGSAFSACSSGQSYTDLDDGEHTFRARAVAGGNTDPTPASATFTVDAFPRVSIDSGPSGETSSIDATFEFSADEAGATVAPATECRLDDGGFRPCSSPITYTDLDDGQHTFTVRATDDFGKQSTDERTWTIDAVGSNTVIDAAPPARTSSQSATLAFSSPDDAATFECSVDGAPFEPCDSPVELQDLAEGPHTFRARAIDAAGIVDPTPALASWRVDLTPPSTAIDSGPGALTTDGTPTFEFSADEPGSTFACSVDAGEFGPCDSPFTLGELSDGDHDFAVRATDVVGNADESPATRSFTIDRVAPSTRITSGPSEGSTIASDSATFSFDSSDGDAAAFRCRLDDRGWGPCQSSGSQSYSGLDDGRHEFSVRAIDDAGNVDASPPKRAWTVDTKPPQTAIADGPSGTERSANATFELRASDPEASFECSLDGAAFEACDSPKRYSGLNDGQHTFRARAVDSVGNADATPSVRSWRINTAPQAPPNPPKPPKRACYFDRDIPRCGDPFMRVHAAAARPRIDTGDRGFGKLVLKANGGGSALSSATFAIPPKLRLRVVDSTEGAHFGRLDLFGFSRRSTLGLDSAPGEEPGRGQVLLAAGEPTVKIDRGGRRVAITNIPRRVRRLRIALSSDDLVVETNECGTRSWEAKLRDRRDDPRRVTTVADVRCPNRWRR